jgi:serine/threonine protein kinase
MNRMYLTPIQKLRPRVSDLVADIIDKCMEIQPKDRYQTADELRYDLMEARSISRRKLPLELVLSPPPITLHDKLPEATDHNSGFNIPEKGNNAERDKRRSTRTLSNNPDEIEVFSVKNKAPKRSVSRLLLVLLPILLLSGFATYAIRPEFVKQMIGYAIPGIYRTPTFTTAVPTNTNIPILAIESKTPTPSSTPSPSETLSPTFTPSPSLSPTITQTRPPTPMGGSEQIAFASTRSGAVEIWLMNNDGTGLKQITNIPEGACQPRWSPDGSQIVFISPCTRHQNSYPGASLFIINADGTGLVPLPNAPGGDYDPSWSKDEHRIAFTSLRKGGVPGIYIIDLVDYSIVSLVEDETRAIYQPAWSPDGTEIAYVNSDKRIWVMDDKGVNRRNLMVARWISGDLYTISPIRYNRFQRSNGGAVHPNWRTAGRGTKLTTYGGCKLFSRWILVIIYQLVLRKSRNLHYAAEWC